MGLLIIFPLMWECSKASLYLACKVSKAYLLSKFEGGDMVEDLVPHQTTPLQLFMFVPFNIEMPCSNTSHIALLTNFKICMWCLYIK